jgi:hypothetical protein
LVVAFRKIKGTDDVQFLNELLLTAPTEVGRWLSSSSREWADASSIPYLIGALDRLDKPGQYECIVSLVRVTKRGWPGPGHSDFRADPNKYIDDWKVWWRAGQPESVPPVVADGVKRTDEAERQDEAAEVRPRASTFARALAHVSIGAAGGMVLLGLILVLRKQGKRVKR